jgi:hypothetical protein
MKVLGVEKRSRVPSNAGGFLSLGARLPVAARTGLFILTEMGREA